MNGTVKKDSIIYPQDVAGYMKLKNDIRVSLVVILTDDVVEFYYQGRYWTCDRKDIKID
jgi:hypothetical protein